MTDAIKKTALLFLIFAFILCGCNKKENISSDVSSNFSSSEIVENTVSNIPADDTLDPENTESDTQSGATVTAEQLENKKGKANGIDVSKWQGKIDWKKVKSSGIDFAIIRIGYRAEDGNIYKDPNADYNIQQADKAGLLIGVYFYSTALNTAEAVSEAKWVAEAVKGYPISYPVVYDCESFMDPSSRIYALSVSKRTDNALAFLGHIKSSGYDGMFYAAKSDIENSYNWQTERIAAKYKIWVAHYSEITYPAKENPDYSGKYDMWQYTNMGKVAGIKGNTDMIVSYFTCEKSAPKSNKAPETATAPTETDLTYTSVNDKVTAKDVVNLRDAATTKSNTVGKLKNGEVLTRTATGTNGWSKLLWGGKTVYAITSYLTTDLNFAPPKEEQVTDSVYSTVNEKVTAKDTTNLRTVASSKDASTIVHTLKNGEIVTRTGIGTNGWSRLEYNGQTVYAITSYLTTDLTPKAPETSESKPEPPSDGFKEVNEQVTAKSETNLRTEPSSKNPDTVVYTLKNGEFVTRIGINEASGWSKLSYNGQTVYAITSYLIKEESE